MTNWKRLYTDASKMLESYQDEIVPGYRKMLKNRVEVVRCKDCKWYQIRNWDDGKPKYDCRKTHALLDVKPEDFCSYGERKGNESRNY